MAVLSTKQTTAWAEVDEYGRLVIPPEVARQYGLDPGSKVRLDEGTNFVRMHRPVTHLAKTTSNQPLPATSTVSPASATPGTSPSAE